MSTTLINKQLTHTYGNGDDIAGLVLNPSQAQLLCSYGNDGGTMTKLCDPPGLSATCIPGCYDESGKPNWCTSTNVWGCAHPPQNLSRMLELQMGAGYTYNELVLGTEAWMSDPIASIEAVFFKRGNAEQASKARGIYERMVREHRNEDVRGTVPILSFDVSDMYEPFGWRGRI